MHQKPWKGVLEINTVLPQKEEELGHRAAGETFSCVFALAVTVLSTQIIKPEENETNI